MQTTKTTTIILSVEEIIVALKEVHRTNLDIQALPLRGPTLSADRGCLTITHSKA